MGKVAVFDLDGTISLCDHRLHYISGDKRDWSGFYKACTKDEVNWPVYWVLQALHTQGRKIVFLSGRSDEVRTETIEWLNNHGIPFDGLYMRPDKNYEPDNTLKAKMMVDAQTEMGFTKEDVLCIFDDRDKVVKMWRESGYPCFQVRDGAY